LSTTDPNENPTNDSKPQFNKRVAGIIYIATTSYGNSKSCDAVLETKYPPCLTTDGWLHLLVFSIFRPLRPHRCCGQSGLFYIKTITQVLPVRLRSFCMAFGKCRCLSLLLSLSGLALVAAITFPVEIRHVARTPSLQARANVSDQTTGNGTIPLRNNQNTQYITNVTLGGQSIPVLIDTGRYVWLYISSELFDQPYLYAPSSDLWVAADVPGAKDSGKSATLQYAIGKATGTRSAAPPNLIDRQIIFDRQRPPCNLRFR
jgi:hypothetical protein